MVFGYGASGSRIVKQVGADPDLGTGYREQYIRDAQGNVMAIYQYTPAPDQNTPLSFAVTQRPIYGSSRLGLDAATQELSDPNYNENDPVYNGKVRYELTDHLGNVCAVINDMAEGYNTDADPESEEWHPELLSAQEYEPFGSLLPGRNYSSGSYRFGLNGQEKDDEIFGATGTSYTAEFWQYDPRTARRWNMDPVTIPSLSSYHAFELNPIWKVDPKGNKADDYKAAADGSIELIRKTDDDFDVLYNDFESGAVQVDKGVLGGIKSNVGSYSGELFDYDFMKVKGDDKATSLFEFLGQNTNVEWSLSRFGLSGDKGLNILSTSHEKSRESSVNWLFSNQFEHGYTFREHIHNHPSSTPFPSGLFDGTGDIPFSKHREETYLSSYPGRNRPLFKIYTPATNSYINYNKDSQFEDFDIIFHHTLPEVEITN